MIKINNLTFGYEVGKDVISDFSAEFKAGERVCISAASGKGKTTLMRLIAGLEKPQAGQIIIKPGMKIGLAFQNDVLLPWKTAIENVAAVCNRETAEKWLNLFGMLDKFNSYPDELSGGMCKRVSLARAVGYEPDILLLDEAFKGLDFELKESIMNELKSHFESRLIIFSSHDKAEIDSFATQTIKL